MLAIVPLPFALPSPDFESFRNFRQSGFVYTFTTTGSGAGSDLAPRPSSFSPPSSSSSSGYSLIQFFSPSPILSALAFSFISQYRLSISASSSALNPSASSSSLQMRFLSRSSGSMMACLLLRFLISSRASISSISLLESQLLFSRYFMESPSFSLILSFLRYFSACWASLMASQFLVPPASTTQSWFLGSVLKVTSAQQYVHLKQKRKTLIPRQVSSLQISILMLNLVPMQRQLAHVLHLRDIGNMLRTIMSLSLPRPRLTMMS